MAQITLNSTGVASDGALVLQSNGTTTAVTITTAQNVGIGTASPSVPFDVQANSSAQGIRVRGRASGDSSSVAFYSNNNATEQLSIFSSSSENAFFGTGSRPMTFSTNNAERMQIDSSGNVGIGTSSPSAKLHVVGDALANTFKLIANTTVSGSDATIFRPADNTLAFSTNGTERARINSSGYVTMPYQPMFSVTHSATETPAANGNFVQWTALSVASGSFSSGVYTAPVAGKYLITASLLKNTGSAAGGVHLAKNGANVYRIFYCDGGASGGYQMGSGQCILTLAANDTISLRQEIAGIGWYGDSPGLGAFSANLLG